MMMDQLLVDVVRERKYWGRVAWKELCSNPWVDFSLLRSFSDKVPMIQKYQHLHPDFPPELILDAPRDWAYFSRTAPISFILATLEKPDYHWVFRSLCQNPGMTPVILQERFWPFLSYDVRHAVLRDPFLWQHPNFSIGDFDGSVINVHALSHHPHFTPSWLPKKRWDELDWKHLSANMDPSFIERTLDSLPWSVEGLSHHPRLPFSLVLRYRRHKRLDWDAVSLNVRLPDLVAHHHNLPFRYPMISRNLHLRAWFVREYPTKKWDRVQLAMNPAMVPREILEDRLLFPVWRWDHVLRNPSLDLGTLEKMHHTFVKRLVLVKNHFSKDPRFVELQAMRIQKFFGYLVSRRHVTKRLAFLRHVYDTLDTDTWQSVLCFI